MPPGAFTFIHDLFAACSQWLANSVCHIRPWRRVPWARLPTFGGREAESENRMFDQPIIIIGNFLLL
jgi:hypothetical protein